MRALRAWPALDEWHVDGWVLRFAHGFTKRANSANALTPSTPFRQILRQAEVAYGARALPPIFRLSPLAPVEADAILADGGYALADPSLVLVAPLKAPMDSAGLAIDAVPADAWLDGVARANGIADRLRPAFRAVAMKIGGEKAFATLWAAGRPVAHGCAVVDGGMVGLFEIVVAPHCRGRGFGRALTTGLLHWGQAAGAGSAYLQVTAGNGAARDLYDSLGFVEAYRYHYRVKAR